MEPLSLAEMIHVVSEAGSLSELRGHRDRLHEELQRRLLFDHPLDWNRMVNQVHDAIIQRTIQLSEQMLAEEGDMAPVAYAFLLFGSGGRGEQTLWSDQDNGLIYENPSSPEQQGLAESYFARFAERISTGLEVVGYPPCSGGVICTNAMWRRPLSGYQALIKEWLEDPHWENVRYLLIAADMRVVYGDDALGREVLKAFYDYVASHPSMLEHLLHNTLHHKVSLGVFGQLIKERYGEDAGGVDIKYGAYIPIVNGIRLLSIEAGLYASGTEERIIGLLAGDDVEEEIGYDWLEALSIALKLRSVTPYQVIDGHYTTRGKLTSEQLTKERVSALKLCLRIGSDLQKYVKKSVHKEIEKG
jgi:CBS domain-containing protein